MRPAWYFRPCCKQCRYYEPMSNEEGMCHRHAPRPAMTPPGRDEQMLWVEWPRVERYDWCGEWDGTPWPELPDEAYEDPPEKGG